MHFYEGRGCKGIDLPKKSKFHCVNWEKFLEEYHQVITQGGTTKNLAERLGMSKKTVQRHYGRYQLPPLDGGKMAKLLSDAEFVSIYHQARAHGGNYVYIAQKAGCSVTTVRRRAMWLFPPGRPGC